LAVNRFLPRTTDGTDRQAGDDAGQPTTRGVARKLLLALGLAAFAYAASRISEAVQATTRRVQA